MFVKPRIQLVLVACLMLAGLYFMQTYPRSPSVEASQGTLDAANVEPVAGNQVELRQVAATEPTPEAPAKIQAVIWTKEVKLIDEIITSKNDNDPRLDTELRVLSDEAKAALKSYYLSRPEEDRNGKGTVLFVLGRNLNTAQDVQFLADALKESPCRSLADCSTEPTVIDHHESQHDTAPEVTMAYPKVVTLTMFEKELSNPTITPELRRSILESVKAATQSEEPIVQRRASAIIEKLNRRRK